MRVVNKNVLKWVVEERDRVCLYGLYSGDPDQFGLDPHHIEKVSQFGDDVPENVITLCRKHHDMAEANLISQEELREVLSFFYGYEYE
jgi:predicted restriction endonuclease